MLDIFMYEGNRRVATFLDGELVVEPGVDKDTVAFMLFRLSMQFMGHGASGAGVPTVSPLAAVIADGGTP